MADFLRFLLIFFFVFTSVYPIKGAQELKEPLVISETKEGAISASETKVESFVISEGYNTIVFEGSYDGHSEDVSIELIDPQGKIEPIEKKVVDIFGAKVDFFGAYISNPKIGTWKIRLHCVDSAKQPIKYAIGLKIPTNVVLKLHPETPYHQYQGKIITLEASLREENSPITSATVVARVCLLKEADSTPLNQRESIILKDNGISPDKQKGDGLYTAEYAVTKGFGSYIVVLSAQGKDHRGQPFNISQFIPHITILPDSVEYGIKLSLKDEELIDKESDGLIDSIIIPLQVDIAKEGKYQISATLEDSNHNPVSRFWKEEELGVGLKPIALQFDTKKIVEQKYTGPLFLKDLSIVWVYDPSELPVLAYRHTESYKTRLFSWLDFQRDYIYLTGNYTFEGVDNDSNGKYEALRLSLETILYFEGDYNINASLESNKVHIIHPSNNKYYNKGKQNIVLDFPGFGIKNAHIDGPYEAKNIFLSKYLGSPHTIDNFEGREISLIVFDSSKYRTKSYRWEDFE